MKPSVRTVVLATAFVGSVVVANVVTSRFGLIPAGFGLLVPAGTYAAGLALGLRDALQEAAGLRAVFAAIVVGAVVSALLGDGRIARLGRCLRGVGAAEHGDLHPAAPQRLAPRGYSLQRWRRGRRHAPIPVHRRLSPHRDRRRRAATSEGRMGHRHVPAHRGSVPPPTGGDVMRFYLGTHETSWLWRTTVPLFVSRRRLEMRTRLRPATCRWALDSGGFTELSMFGRWKTPADRYAEQATSYTEQIGGMDWAAPQDWMCEPFMVARTGLSVREHQERTVSNYLELRALAPDLPIIPVLQGWEPRDYETCRDLYAQAGVDLAAESIVGLGSVCRRQHTTQIAHLISDLAVTGLRMHGFGVKTLGLHQYGYLLVSADSLAWSYRARRSDPLPGCAHRSCANCLPFATAWRSRLLDRLDAAPIQPTLAESLAGVA